MNNTKRIDTTAVQVINREKFHKTNLGRCMGQKTKSIDIINTIDADGDIRTWVEVSWTLGDGLRSCAIKFKNVTTAMEFYDECCV